LGGDLVVEGVHSEFVVEFAEVELDFVGVHFLFTLGFRVRTFGLRLGALFAGAGEFVAFGADFGTGGEVR
jgi:hypothetical protein